MHENINDQNGPPNIHDSIYSLSSPDSKLRLEIGIKNQKVWYSLLKDNQTVVEPSLLELVLSGNGNDVKLAMDDIKIEATSLDETWEQPWGEQRLIRNNFNEVQIKSNDLTVRFRLFNDGIGFRYEINGSGRISINHEFTQFNIPTHSKVWWIPSYQEHRYEYTYSQSVLSDIPTSHTPLTSQIPTGKFVAIHEAALYDYGAMNLKPTNLGLSAEITPLNDGHIAHVDLPFNTPWRTITVGEEAIDLINSHIMLNLNQPSKIEDTSWIKPTKFMGIWWALHLGVMTWSSGENHGATTKNAMRHIDYCQEFGIPALLIEGWNETWDGDWMQNGAHFNQTKPYPDFDIAKVTEYARQKGVDIIGHHETAANMHHYESQLPEAYDYYKNFGIRYIKTGYVGPRINNGEFHHSQIGVRHYQMTVEMAAERGIMLNIHEPIKGTGIERTWPNLLTREGAVGQEYEGGRIQPDHTTILPFTRLLSGGMDYTPGLIDLTNPDKKVSSTLAKQLALYVTIYSAMQMAAEIPEKYRNTPSINFIRQVPVNWETTIPIDGVIGDYYVVARKDRHSNDWYIGAITNQEAREIDIDLSFLEDDTLYSTTIYQDHSDAHWQDNPEAMEVVDRITQKGQRLHLDLAPGGGAAIRLTPSTARA